MQKVALITGSSKGIGKAIAIAFAKNNYYVVINCKNSIKELNETLNEIKEITNNVLAIQTD
ncbi:MAG: SDR family NAD(P)-dependent oxidoreductase, partial [Eubacteriales bacterium]|nr:SDR family NAD(P)-dependent oxidoreductase [Eubacteriales bacterium]